MAKTYTREKEAHEWVNTSQNGRGITDFHSKTILHQIKLIVSGTKWPFLGRQKDGKFVNYHCYQKHRAQININIVTKKKRKSDEILKNKVKMFFVCLFYFDSMRFVKKFQIRFTYQPTPIENLTGLKRNISSSFHVFRYKSLLNTLIN